MSHPYLAPVIELVRAAGEAILPHWRNDVQVHEKADASPVTAADMAAHHLLADGLRALDAAIPVLSEEDCALDLAERAGWSRWWLVDPLDGTTNFLHGMPHWAVSVALEHKGEVVAGVVFDAAKDEMFYAEKGSGAWLNDSQRLRVSGRSKMIESVFATGVPFAGGRYLPACLQDLARLMPECAGVRRWGAASLDLAYVAAGRYDGYWERGLQPWDIAAGVVIAREAGALVQPIREGQSLLEDGHIVAGAEAIFDPFAKLIRSRETA